MTTTNRRTFVMLAAAAFAAAALFPPPAAAQETGQKAVPEKPAVGPKGPMADLGLTTDQVKALEAFRKARTDERRAGPS